MYIRAHVILEQCANEWGVAVTSVAHHRAVSSISQSVAYDQFQRGRCVHKYTNEIFRMQTQHSVAPFQSGRNCVPMLSSISMHTPLASILHSSPGVRRN